MDSNRKVIFLAGPIDSVTAEKVIYLAGPIDSVTAEVANNWRAEAAIVLSQAGHMTYHPNKPFFGLDIECYNHCEYIDRVNRIAILTADFVLANIDKPSLGTMREIEYAIAHEIRVIGFTHGRVIRNVMAYDFETYSNIEEAIQSIIDD